MELDLNESLSKRRRRTLSPSSKPVLHYYAIFLILTLLVLVLAQVSRNASAFTFQTPLSPPAPSAALQTILRGKSVQKMSLLEALPLVNGQNEVIDASTLDNKLTLLYFAASWCPDCRRFGPTLSAFTDSLPSPAPAEVVLVSSDDTEEKMLEHIQQTNVKWSAIPFGDEEKRSQLKIQLGACAAREVPNLEGIERTHGIPTIAVFTRQKALITMNGADDINQLGNAALEKWEKEATETDSSL
mmetsp:Transcript_20951/g.27061  ORF Transcript_20951/g.27061 Transcript_20951/m.27061 type:complete len:243 (+) Transcript_20951:28-756(+)